MTLKDQHDQLLAKKPEGVEHDVETCVFCNPEILDPHQGGDETVNTYTEDELSEAVKAAVAPVQAELKTVQTELESVRNSALEGEIDTKVAAAKAEAEEKVTELQAELDKAEARIVQAEKDRDDVIAWLEAEAKAAEEAALIEGRKTERLEAVQAAASFSETYVESNIDRWVAMDEDQFTALLEDLKVIASTSNADAGTKVLGLPAETAMDNTTTTSKPSSNSAVSDIFSAIRDGADFRTL